jgi:transmembrane sensor
MNFRSSPRFRDRRSAGAVNEVAVDWISRREAGLSAAEEEDFQSWLSADPRHATEIARLEPTWTLLNEPRRAGCGADLRSQVQRVIRRKKRTRHAIQLTSLATAVVVCGFFLFQAGPLSNRAERTIALRPDRQPLSDGSEIDLNAGAQVEIDFTPDFRRVRLVSGEAMFKVEKDPARPFIVVAGHVAVRAVGTAFMVRLEPKMVDVLVTEGSVTVEKSSTNDTQDPADPSGAANEPNDLRKTAGHQMPSPVEDLFPAPSAGVLLATSHRLAIPVQSESLGAIVPRLMSATEIALALAWQNRRVEFNDTLLEDAVELFNRDNPSCQLVIGDWETGAKRLTGVFWTNDPEAFSRALETSLGLTATRGKDGIVLRK